MQPVLVIYATRHGYTRHIALRAAADLKSLQHSFELVDAAHIPKDFSLAGHSAAIVAASLHLGKYEDEMAQFVKHNLAVLQQLPSVFISVSLEERIAEDPAATPARRAQAEANVNRSVHGFLAETGWRPTQIAVVAGALMYSKYDFVTRFIMRLISKHAGAPVDTTRDYEFTNWTRLDAVVGKLVQSESGVKSAAT
jgi:menaquinone-dependent protoporphyrinogen oxidase